MSVYELCHVVFNPLRCIRREPVAVVVVCFDLVHNQRTQDPDQRYSLGSFCLFRPALQNSTILHEL